MKKIILLILAVILLSTSFISCGGKSDKELLCSKVWASSVNVIEFMQDGKIRYNFGVLDESNSYYKLLSGGKIKMYTDEGEDLGMTFDYRIEEDVLYIGELKYTVIDEKDSQEDEIVESGPFEEVISSERSK